MEPPTVDYQKNLETMRQSGSPESVMFTPGRQLESIDQQIMRGEARRTREQEIAAKKAAELAATKEFLLKRQAEQEGYGVGSFGQDIAGATAKGIVGLGQSAAGLAQLATGWIPDDPNINPLQIGQWGKMLDKLGYDPEATSQFISGLQSPQMQLQQNEVAQAKGFFNTAAALAVNPLALLDSIVESLPGTVGAGAAGGKFVRYLAGKATQEAAERGLTGAAAQKFIAEKVKEKSTQIAAAASAAEGAQTAGSIADQARAAGKDWDEYVAPALAAGFGTAAIGVVAGKAASKLGIGDVETEIAARSAGVKGVGVGAADQSLAKVVRNELIKEGVFEEMPQSVQEQIFTNLATGRPWNEGVEEAAAQGLMAGAGMGGGHAVIARALQRTGEIVQEQTNKLAQSIVDQRQPSAEELAKSKGFLRKEGTKKEKSEDDLIADLDKYNQEQIDAEEAAPPQTEDEKLAAKEAADERAAIQTTHEFVPLQEDQTVPEPPDIFGKKEEAAPAAVQEAAPAVAEETDLQRADRLDAEAAEQETAQEARKANAREIAKTNFDAAIDQVDSLEFNGDLNAAFDSYKQNTLDTLAEKGEKDQYVSDAADREFDRLVAEHNEKQTPTATLEPVKDQETIQQIRRENPTNGVSLGDWTDPNTDNLWDGANYYAGIAQRYGGPTSLTPVTTLAEAKQAEANGKSIYAVNKPEPATVEELQTQRENARLEMIKLHTKTGNRPKTGTKKRETYDALQEKLNKLDVEIAKVAKPEAPEFNGEPAPISTDLVVITPPAAVQQVPALPPPDQASPDLQAVYDSAAAKAKKAWEVLSLADEALSQEEDPSDGSQPSPVKLKRLTDERNKAHAEWEVLEKEAENAFTALTHEPYTVEGEVRIVEETVAPQLAALPAPDVNRLEKHYGLSAGSRDFVLKVKEDIVRYANEGAEVIAEAIRDIIGKLHAGVLTAAIIFNPTNVSTAEFVTYPTATIAITEQVLADLPAGTEMMSDGAKQSYKVLYPSIKDKLQANNKILTIVDKPKGHTYVFNPDGTLLLRTKTLTGLAPGDFYKGNNNLPQNRITPAGFFTFGLRDAMRSVDEAKTAGEYDFGKVFVLDKVIGGEYSMTLMHSVWMHESDAAMRAKAIASESETDSRYSFGCINVNKQTYKFLIDNHLKQMDGSSVFVVPDNPANLASLLSGKPENRDGLERNVFTPPTKTVNRTIDSATTTPNLASAAAADRRRNMFRSIVANALPDEVGPDLTEAIAHNQRGINKLDALYKDGKITPEQYAEAMLKINESIRERADRSRSNKSKQRGFGRVVTALEDAKKAGRISPETADFAIWFLIQNPALADDLAIKIALPKTKREKEATEGTAGNYNPIAKIVRLVTRKAPTPFEAETETERYAATKEDTAVHEILHHLERMLPVQVRRLIRNEWSRQIRDKLKEAAKTKNTALQFYLNNVIKANTEQDMVAWTLASKAIQDGDVPYEMYALFNPSEFWAVNASNLLSDRYYAGTKFQKAKQWMREFIETLKSIFGLSSDDPIIQGLNAVLRGDGTFVSKDMLSEGKPDQTFRQIVQKGLHPSVVEAINNNDISGALRAVAKNTSGIYSVLAARLAELNLPTTIGFNRERELVRQHIDSKSSQQQVQLFTYVRRAYPELFEKYFKNYDRSESLELVYAGLKELYKPQYNTSALNMQLALVRDEFDKAMPGLTHSGLYMPSSDAISLRTSGQFGLTNRVFLHEVVHAATEFVLRDTKGLSQRQREAVTQLYVMYNYAKSQLNIEAYGFKNVFEFVAEALTNADFQKKLRTVEYEPAQGSVYNSLLRFAMKMFGADNVAGATIIQANEIFSAFRPAGAVNAPLRFGPPIKGKKGRYKKGPITSKWRTAEDAAVRLADALKGAMSSIPEASSLASAVRRAGKFKLRNLEFPFLGLRMLKEDVQQSNPYIGSAVKIITDMLAYRGRMLSRAKDTIQKWAQMQLDAPAQSRLMSRVMLEATIQGIEVDPLGPGYVNPLTAGPNDKVAPQPLVDAWNKLDPKFQNLYREVRNYYTDLLKATIREMKMRVLTSGKTSAEKKDLIRKINKQFAEENFSRPYFPLRRFGDFWFQVTANGRTEFYTFENHIDRDLAYDKRYAELSKGNVTQQAAAESMRAGNTISQLYTDNKNIGGALKDVNELIDSISDTVTTVQGGQAFTTKKSADAIKSEIKGAIDQLVYVLLPQQSMRKMFINRRAIQGASGDMLRVFADTSVRAAYQQSRFKFVQPFLNNMSNAHDYIRAFVQGKRQTEALDYINEVEKRYKHIFSMEDKSALARFAGGANQMMFMVNLTAPASALMNVLAFPIMAERTIGGKYGIVKANAVMAKYFGQYMRTLPKRTLVPMGKGLKAEISWPSIVEGGYLKGASARAAQKFADDGDINVSQTSDVFDFAERPSELYSNGMFSRVMQGIAMPFHQLDRLTREVTLMSVFDLAYEQYLTADKRDERGVIQRDTKTGNPLKYTEEEAFNAAIEDARDAAAASLGEYLRQLKGRAFSGPVGALVMQFKQVSVTIFRAIYRDMWLAFGAPLTTAERDEFKKFLTEQYKGAPNATQLVEQQIKEYEAYQKEIHREAFRKVVIINATAFLMAGAEGTPLYFLVSLLPAIARVFAPDGEDWDDFETWFFNMLMNDFSGAVSELAMQSGMDEESAEALAKKAAHAVARGIPAAVTNWSLTERIGINPGEMLFRNARYYADAKQELQDMVISNLGAFPSYMLDNVPTAYQLVQQGHYERAYEKLFPAIATKPAVAYRFSEEGAKRISGKTVLHKDEFDKLDIAAQAVGIRPEKLTLVERASSAASEKMLRLNNKKSQLLDRIWVEHLANSPAENIARQEFYKFAYKHPNFIDDPEKTIEDSFEKKYEGLASAGVNLGVDIPENLLPEVAPILSGAKKLR
jgi:hypothetical protein